MSRRRRGNLMRLLRSARNDILAIGHILKPRTIDTEFQ